jgi:hypothetical protein
LSCADRAERLTDTATSQEARSHVLIEPEVALREAASRRVSALLSGKLVLVIAVA